MRGADACGGTAVVRWGALEKLCHTVARNNCPSERLSSGVCMCVGRRRSSAMVAVGTCGWDVDGALVEVPP